MDATTHEPIAVTESAKPEQKLSPWRRAGEIQRSARGVLGGHSGGISHRLLLTLSVITVLTVSIALYTAVACLTTAGYLVFGENALWVDVVSNILLVALGLTLALPLAVSVGRLASLMAAPDGEVLRSIPTDGTVAGLRAALDSLDTAGVAGTVTLRRPTLDDVFLHLTGGATPTASERTSA